MLRSNTLQIPAPSMRDFWGRLATEGRMHTCDLHATLLALMGLDHEQLTYNYAGRDFRLTDVAGIVNRQIFS